LSEVLNSFLRPWKNKAFEEERRTKIRLYDIANSTIPESTKSHL
jgi:hypothetical protein